jgi:hypothetical protein
VTVCAHGPATGKNGRPRIDVTVAVHAGAIDTGLVLPPFGIKVLVGFAVSVVVGIPFGMLVVGPESGWVCTPCGVLLVVATKAGLVCICVMLVVVSKVGVVCGVSLAGIVTVSDFELVGNACGVVLVVVGTTTFELAGNTCEVVLVVVGISTFELVVTFCGVLLGNVVDVSSFELVGTTTKVLLVGVAELAPGFDSVKTVLEVVLVVGGASDFELVGTDCGMLLVVVGC